MRLVIKTRGEQSDIEYIPAHEEDWRRNYINFGGFFGPYKPDLFAAAPELLAALQLAERQLVAAYGEPDGSNLENKAGATAIYQARAAMLKAEGALS